MDEQRSRYAATWDELETSVHVPSEEQVTMHDVAVREPMVPPAELDRQQALGVVGDFRLSR